MTSESKRVRGEVAAVLAGSATSGELEAHESVVPHGPTIPVEERPSAAVELCGEHLETVQRFAGDVARYGNQLGLIGPSELSRLWSRHLLNSALVAPLLWPNARVADVGSGAGLPGLVLAIIRPDVLVYLIEPMERRTDWLRAEADRLRLTNVVVLRARAEEARLDVAVDQATARAVSALSKLLPITVPLVKPGGQVVLMKGQRVGDEIIAAKKVIARLRLTDAEVLELGAEQLGEVTRVFRATVS